MNCGKGMYPISAWNFYNNNNNNNVPWALSFFVAVRKCVENSIMLWSYSFRFFCIRLSTFTASILSLSKRFSKYFFSRLSVIAVSHSSRTSFYLSTLYLSFSLWFVEYGRNVSFNLQTKIFRFTSTFLAGFFLGVIQHNKVNSYAQCTNRLKFRSNKIPKICNIADSTCLNSIIIAFERMNKRISIDNVEFAWV